MLHYAGPPSVGGVEVTIAAHARFLVEHGHRVRILAASGDLGSGVETVVLPELGSRGDAIDVVNRELAAGTTSARFDRLVDRIAALISGSLADASVLIVHNVLTMNRNLALTAALARLHEHGALPPMIAWCHDFAWTDPLYLPGLHPGPPWDLLRQRWPGVHYVVVSTDRQRTLAELQRTPADEIHVIPPGVDLAAFLKLEPATVALVDRFDLLAADPLLLLPARITRRKNIELGIAITTALRDQGMTPRLVVTGPPDPHNPTMTSYLGALRTAARDAGTGDAVVFLHDELVAERGAAVHVSDEMMADLFRLADGVLFPSRAEGFGIPMLEAGLSGLPIFSSDVPVLREVVPEATVSFGLDEDPGDIAARIAEALRADPRYSLRRRVRRHFTWSAICARHLLPLLFTAGGQRQRGRR
jgi:glycosyltransferase involved in cell wall biosynthesis